MLKLPKTELGDKHKAIVRSPEQEKEIAQRVGGKKTPASGALNEKGDVRVKDVVRLEAKTTQKKSFSVTREMVDKIENAAIANNELPVMEVEFIDEDGKPVSSVCITPTYVVDMIGEIKR